MKESILALIKREVVPALGCTEPIAVAFAAARSCEVLREAGYEPDVLEAEVSANILKNGMGVGIPGTGMVGLHIAVALAAVCGNSEYRLEVLKDLDAEAVAKAKAIVDAGKVKISLSDTEEKLYVRTVASNGPHRAEAVVSGSHDTITSLSIDGMSLPCGHVHSDSEVGAEAEEEYDPELAKKLSLSQIIDFALNTPLEDLEFIMDSVTLNKALSDEGLKHHYGLQVGRTIMDSRHSDIYGDSIMTYAMARTAAASDARMAGCTLPAMSNSGSGNQGITVTVPVIAVAEKTGVGREELIRALTIAHLVAIHIKGHLGRLSALCGCVIASTGAACGITYLRGGGYREICAAVKNMIGNITGMVCDGAKEGCALKVASGVSCALQSAILALDEICISSNDGIIDDDIEKTVANLGRIGSVGMQTTDEMILDIMICK